MTLGFDNHTYYHRGLVRWRHRFRNGATFTLTPSVGYDVPYGLQTNVGTAPFSNTNAQLEYNLRATYRTTLLPWLRPRYRSRLRGYALHARRHAESCRSLEEGDTGGFSGYSAPDATQAVATDHLLLYTNSVAPFIALDFAYFKKRFVISPQLRLETMTFYGYPGQARQFSSASFLPEPRVAVRYVPIAQLALHASVGVYHQAPDSPDFSTVFGSAKLQPQFGIHYVLGAEFQPTSRLHFDEIQLPDQVAAGNALQPVGSNQSSGHDEVDALTGAEAVGRGFHLHGEFLAGLPRFEASRHADVTRPLDGAPADCPIALRCRRAHFCGYDERTDRR